MTVCIFSPSDIGYTSIYYAINLSEIEYTITEAHLEVANDSSSSTYTLCNQTGYIPDGSSLTVGCGSPVIARYVRLRQNAGLAVCEVIVRGHLYVGT